MGDISILIIGIIDTLFGFFVVAPCILNAVSLFGVQKQFAKAMVDEGVIKAEDVQRIHPKKQIAGIIVSALVLAVLVYTCAKSAPWGYACGGVATVVGFLKYRNIVQYNSLTVKRFRNTYKEDMDVKKFNKFVKRISESAAIRAAGRPDSFFHIKGETASAVSPFIRDVSPYLLAKCALLAAAISAMAEACFLATMALMTNRVTTSRAMAMIMQITTFCTRPAMM